VFPFDAAYAHLHRLATRHGIEVIWIKSQWDSEAAAGTKQVFIPRPTTPLRYLIGLHEFGHLVDKVAARVMVKHYPCAEAAAWAWAIEHADQDLLTWVTPREWTKVGHAWLTGVTDLSPDVR
jgi:hypothetical protein